MRHFLVAIWLIGCTPFSWALHAYSQFGDIKYPARFHHFDYVNPLAPKGGRLVLVPPTRLTQFDKYNPFTLKGSAAPGLVGLVFESLLIPSWDEPTTAYGLLAEDVHVAPDRRSVIFRLNSKARFNNGQPVLAQDVQHTFLQLTSQHAAPQYRALLSEVQGVTVLDDLRIRFNFKRANAELPLIVGSLPVFSRAWGQQNHQERPLDQIVTDLPIGSGPYRIGRVNFGKDITYDRDPHYWAQDLNVRRGQFNFDHITFKIYKDNTAQLEAFKAGEFDYIQAFIAREWARAYTGRAFDKGQLIKKELPNGNAGDFQGFQFNVRREKFKDVRVRQAIELALDFEWMNRQLFYKAYTRVRGFFVASDFEARGLPGADEIALLAPLRAQLPAEVFTQEVPLPPEIRASGPTLRDQLRRAKDLLSAAGWIYRDGALRNAQGEAFILEILDSSGSMGRVVTPFAHNLKKLGIEVRYEIVDFAVLQKRLDVFDFDMTSSRTVGSQAPGAELLERFGSKAANVEGSSNIIGIQDPAVDALLGHVMSAQTRPQLVTSLRALDRVLRFGHYVVPHWYASTYRIAYRAQRFAQPTVMPHYYQPESWVLATWWARTAMQ